MQQQIENSPDIKFIDMFNCIKDISVPQKVASDCLGYTDDWQCYCFHQNNDSVCKTCEKETASLIKEDEKLLTKLCKELP
jgi:hypothetical protein